MSQRELLEPHKAERRYQRRNEDGTFGADEKGATLHFSTAKSGARKSKTHSLVAGRNASTGKFVLAPASKAGTISLKMARTAVRKVSAKKKTK